MDDQHPPGETPKQRRDRELIELLNELRLAAPGVQVLFGFLLIVPFNSRWDETSTFERSFYLAALLFCAAAAIMLLGASVQHRLLFRRQFERRMLWSANRLALIGLTCLAAGIVCSLVFVGHVVFGRVAALTIGLLAGLLIVVVWYALPLVAVRRDVPHDDG